jgi:hypothetical protein
MKSKINPATLTSGADRPIVIGRYTLEVFKTALDATLFIRRVKKETGTRPRAWKLVTGHCDRELVGFYAVEMWFGKAQKE